MNYVQKLFSIRDSKGETYFPPFHKNTHGEAERFFQDLARDEKSTINKHPEDFDLYHVGEFDTQSGKIKPLDTPQHMHKAVALLN